MHRIAREAPKHTFALAVASLNTFKTRRLPKPRVQPPGLKFLVAVTGLEIPFVMACGTVVRGAYATCLRPPFRQEEIGQTRCKDPIVRQEPSFRFRASR